MFQKIRERLQHVVENLPEEEVTYIRGSWFLRNLQLLSFPVFNVKKSL
jgi:hypothetical protein